MRSIAATRSRVRRGVLALAFSVASTSVPGSAATKPPVPAALPLGVFASLRADWMAPVTPVFTADGIVAAVRHGGVRALSPDLDDDPTWSAQTGDVQSLAAGGGTVFVATADHLIALDATTGAARWSVPAHATQALVCDADLVLVLTDASSERPANASPPTRVTAYRGTSAQPVWQYDAAARVVLPPAISGGEILIAVSTGAVQSLASASGQPQWRAGFSGTPESLTASARGVWVGTSNKVFYAIDAGGAHIARPRELFASFAAVDDERVYAVGVDSQLYAFDAGSGTLRWKDALPSRAVTAPVVESGLVMLPTSAGVIQLYLAGNADKPAGTLSMTTKDASTQFAKVPVPVIYTGGGGDLRIATITTDAQEVVTLTVFARRKFLSPVPGTITGRAVPWPPGVKVPTSR